MQAMWEVTYKDGRILSQYDFNAPEFISVPEMVTGGEVPYKAIQWSEVSELAFVNVETGLHTGFQYQPPPEGYKTSLRSRVYKALDNSEVHCFVLLVSRADEPINGDSVVQSFYWFPDGSHHWCNQFKCPDVDKLACSKLYHLDHTLPIIHDNLQVTVDAQLV